MVFWKGTTLQVAEKLFGERCFERVRLQSCREGRLGF